MKKIYSHKNKNQIWRILISNTDKLILETRNINTKEVFYCCFKLNTGKKIFSGLQLEEKYWIGIETVYNDIIFFHKFPKPDLPGHKEIIAFDINEQKVIWSNKETAFLFIYNNKVYGFKQGFEERFFYAFELMTGELAEDLGTDFKTVNKLKSLADKQQNWELYLYPEVFHKGETNNDIEKLILKQTNDLDIVGEVEYNICQNILFFNYHILLTDNTYINKFFAEDLNTGKIILSEVLNKESKSLFTDSFFIYKDLLFLLKEKNEIEVYRLK